MGYHYLHQGLSNLLCIGCINHKFHKYSQLVGWVHLSYQTAHLSLIAYVRTLAVKLTDSHWSHQYCYFVGTSLHYLDMQRYSIISGQHDSLFLENYHFVLQPKLYKKCDQNL